MIFWFNYIMVTQKAHPILYGGCLTGILCMDKCWVTFCRMNKWGTNYNNGRLLTVILCTEKCGVLCCWMNKWCGP